MGEAGREEACGVIGSESVRLTLIALFAVLGAGYLAAMVRALLRPSGNRAGQALGDILHVLMSAAMIVMVSSPGPGIPTIAQVTAFTAAAGWFGGQAVFGIDGHHGGGVYRNWFHAGMMAVMVWMAVAMDLASPPVPGGGMGGMSMAAGGASGMSTGGMNTGGMNMTGPTPAGALAMAPAVGSPAWAGTVSAILAAVLLAAAAWQAIVALRPLAAPARGPEGRPGGQPGGQSVTDVALLDGASALMAAGMAVALLEMT
jgi:hypothetical protein